MVGVSVRASLKPEMKSSKNIFIRQKFDRKIFKFLNNFTENTSCKMSSTNVNHELDFFP